MSKLNAHEQLLNQSRKADAAVDKARARLDVAKTRLQVAQDAVAAAQETFNTSVQTMMNYDLAIMEEYKR